MDLGQVDPQHRVQGGTRVKGRSVGLLLGVSSGKQLTGWLRGVCPKPLQDRLDAHVARSHLVLVDVIKLQRLGQGEDVFLTGVADQGLLDRLQRCAAARVAMGGQHLRISLARHDGPDDPHPSCAGDVRDDMVELQVHLRQRLLHVLDMRGGIVQQALALAQVSPQSGGFTPELETGTQQAVLVQAAKPLGIAHIGLASRDMLGVTGVDEHHLEPALLENS